MKRNQLYTRVLNPEEAEALVQEWTSRGAWRVHSMGWVGGQGYWILFESVD